MNTQSKIKELIEKYNDDKYDCLFYASEIKKDLESLLCKHENVKMVRNEKFSGSVKIYNTDECQDCGEKIHTKY